MSKKILCILLMFIVSSFYLNQKVAIYIEAYNLSETYRTYNKLVDARDELLYNFSKKVSLEKINNWVDANGFALAEEEKLLALNINNQERVLKNKKNNIFASSLSRIFRFSDISKVLAQERH